jgi:3-hydroxyisobutyrate dehydrogenase
MEIGLMGTGLMGLPMAQRLVNESWSLIAYNRTTEKLEPLREMGVAIAPAPDVLIRAVDCVVVMVSNATAIQELLCSEASRSQLHGKTVIQMSTIAPSESLAIRDQVVAAGGDYLEAPVLGSIPEAAAGKLKVMVGGTAEQLEQWRDLLECFGAEPLLVGPVGSAAAVKLALNQLIGSLTTAFATSLGFLQHQNVSIDPFMQVLRSSALYAPTFDKKLQRMVDRDFTRPNFPTKHLLKDTNLFLAAAAGLEIDTQIVGAVQAILQQAIDQGLAESDYSALVAAVADRKAPAQE